VHARVRAGQRRIHAGACTRAQKVRMHAHPAPSRTGACRDRVGACWGCWGSCAAEKEEARDVRAGTWGQVLLLLLGMELAGV